jgi:hypothetical protein
VNWEAIGAVSELLGAIAVFVTLAYLAVQVRHAREDVRRSISQSRADAQREVHKGYRDPLVTTAMVRVFERERARRGAVPRPSFMTHAMERWEISWEEAVALNTMCMEAWEARLLMIPHADKLTPIERHHFDGMIRSLYGEDASYSRAFYELYIKPTQHPDAIAYIEGVIARGA